MRKITNLGDFYTGVFLGIIIGILIMDYFK